MRTMNVLVRGLLATTLFACGGGMGTTSMEAGDEGADVPAAQVPASAVVDTLQWKDTTVQFVNLSDDEQVPSILILRHGAMTQGDPLAQLEEQAGMTVTAAELWLAITGREDVPEVLAIDHLRVTKEEGRSSELLRLDLEGLTSRKSLISDESIRVLFPFQDSQHCWLNVRGENAGVGPLVGTRAYACTSPNPSRDQTDANFLHFANVTASTACPTSFNTTSTIRAGARNLQAAPQTSTQIEQLCFDSGSGWRCLDPLALVTGGSIVADLQADASHPHRMGIGVSDNVNNNVAALAAGRKITAPPISTTNGLCR